MALTTFANSIGTVTIDSSSGNRA